MKVCPSCNERFPDDANFCPMDAAELAAVAEASLRPDVRPGPAAAPVPVAAPAAADTLLDGRFRPEEPPEQSVLGEIRIAHDTRQGCPARLIYVAPGLFPSPLVFERTQRELRQLEKSGADGIGRVFGHGRLPDGRMWIASAPLEGEALAALAQQLGPMLLLRACSIVARAGAALLEAQKDGVIHRDVHPGNIRVLVDDRVQIVNFGLAPPLNDRLFGDPRYISPEQVQGKPVDQRSNIYSLAAVLYHLVCGQPPFEGDAEALVTQHETADPVPPSRRRPDLGTALDALIVKAMAKSATRRHLTLRQFVRDVQELGAGAGASAQATPAPIAEPAPASHNAPVAASLQGPPQPAPAEPAAAKTMIFGAEPLILPPRVEALAQAAPVAAPPRVAPVAPSPGPIIAIAPPAAPAESAAPAVSQDRLQDAPADPPAEAPASQTAPESAPPPREPPTPKPAQPPAEPAAAPLPGQFRETLWFAKGEGRPAAHGANGEGATSALADERPVEDRYREDGSLSREDAERLSLRARAKPAAVRAPAHVPVRRVPGQRMDTTGIAREVTGSNRRLAIVIVVMVLAIAALAIVWAVR